MISFSCFFRDFWIDFRQTKIMECLTFILGLFTQIHPQTDSKGTNWDELGILLGYGSNWTKGLNHLILRLPQKFNTRCHSSSF